MEARGLSRTNKNKADKGWRLLENLVNMYESLNYTVAASREMKSKPEVSKV